MGEMRRKVAALLNEPANAQGRPPKGNNVTFPPIEDSGRGNSREYTLRRLKRDKPDLAPRNLPQHHTDRAG